MNRRKSPHTIACEQLRLADEGVISLTELERSRLRDIKQEYEWKWMELGGTDEEHLEESESEIF